LRALVALLAVERDVVFFAAVRAAGFAAALRAAGLRAAVLRAAGLRAAGLRVVRPPTPGTLLAADEAASWASASQPLLLLSRSLRRSLMRFSRSRSACWPFLLMS